MPPGSPQNIEGLDPRAHEAAQAAADAAGMTLAAWLNQTIHAHIDKPPAPDGTVQALVRQLDDLEKTVTHTVADLKQTLDGVSERLGQFETSQEADAALAATAATDTGSDGAASDTPVSDTPEQPETPQGRSTARVVVAMIVVAGVVFSGAGLLSYLFYTENGRQLTAQIPYLQGFLSVRDMPPTIAGDVEPAPGETTRPSPQPAVDPEQATKAAAYRREAENGVAAGQFNLANAHAEGRGVPRDLAKAARWYAAAATQDMPEAQYNLAVLYTLGRGLAPNPQQALRWFFQAAENGHIEAKHRLGVIYATGRGAGQDYAQSATWFRQAADAGHAGAQYYLGYLHAQGLGVALDERLAFVWFARAAEQGDPQAIKARDMMAVKLPPQTLATAGQAGAPDKVRADAAPETSTASSEPEKPAASAKPEKPATAVPAPPPSAAMIRRVQALLKGLGYKPGPVDGVTGARTVKAVRRFQADQNLPVDGEITADLVSQLKTAP